MPNTSGTIRLFQIAGIHVFLHWSWFLVALYEIQQKGRYSSMAWSILEYLVLFAIVTMHEFGHALACRQVGGRADTIVLWPLGGVAYVDPPARPGANLWSISAGPLVNLALVPVLGLAYLGLPASSGGAASDLSVLVRSLNLINITLFLFNVLPIYPLDGGKILRSLLWYVVGRARSLMASVIVGFAGVAGLGVLAFTIQSSWLGILTVFAAIQCFNGYKLAQTLKRMEDTPRRDDLACPACKMNPPMGTFWSCGACHFDFDTFEVNAKCPRCYTTFPKTTCTECGVQSSFSDWSETAIPEVPAIALSRLVNPSLDAPSIIPVVLGIIASLGALVLLLLALLFLKLSSDEAALQPQYKAEIEVLWESEGITVPGEQTLTLKRSERYDAYIEGNSGDTAGTPGIDILVKDANSGVPVRLRRSATRTYLQHDNRKLSPAATFSVPETGRYTVQASSGNSSARIQRIKIGPEIGLVNGANAAAGRGIAIITGVFAVVVLAVAILMFIIYGNRRREFHTRLQRVRM